MTGVVKQKHARQPKQKTLAVTARQNAAVAGFETHEVIAAFRKAARNRGWMERTAFLREVAGLLGYQRLSTRINEALKRHMRAGIRRGIIEADGNSVRTLTASMNDYTREALRDTLISVMRKGTTYEREDVIYAVAHHLGFSRVTDAVRGPIKSAINSGIRQCILGHQGSLIWREQ